MKSRPHGRRAGQALVEFAVAATLFFLMVLAVMQFAMLFNARLLVGHASREGVRYAGLHGADGVTTDADLKQYIISRAAGLSPALDPSQITITPPDTSGRATGQQIRVRVSYDARPSIPLIAPLLPAQLTFAADSQVMME